MRSLSTRFLGQPRLTKAYVPLQSAVAGSNCGAVEFKAIRGARIKMDQNCNLAILPEWERKDEDPRVTQGLRKGISHR
jgi:hypothetical protein